MPKLSSYAAASTITGAESLPLIQGGANVVGTARDFHPYDYVIDARTDAQAGTALLNAVSALTSAGNGGEIKVMAGAVNLGTTKLTVPNGVTIKGVGTGWRSSAALSLGTRLYWSGDTTSSCIDITGHGSGLVDMSIYAAATHAGNIVAIQGGVDGSKGSVLERIRIAGGPSSTTLWGLVINDAYHSDVRSVHLDVSMNGVLIDTVSNPYNIGNSVYTDMFVFQNFNNTVGIKINSPSLTQRTNLMTFNQCGALCNPGVGTGCTALMLRGASRLVFNGADLENHEVLLDIGVGGGNGPTSHNTFVNSYLNSSTYGLKNVVCDATSTNNTFVGGWMIVPSAQTSELQYDLTKGTADPNYYYHVKKSSAGYFTET